MNKTNFHFKDSVNCSMSQDFTQLPNELLRHPEITAKAKVILGILLSHKEGWKSHATSFKTFMKERDEAIHSGLRELEEWGYLVRVKCREEISKKIVGSFWAYTDIPFQFIMIETIEYMLGQSYEVSFNVPEKAVNGLSVFGKAKSGKPVFGFSVTKNINIKNTNYKNTKKRLYTGEDTVDEIKEEITRTKKHPDQILLDKIENNGKSIDPVFIKPFMMWLKYKRNRGESYKDPDSTFLAYQKLVKLSNNNPKQAVEVIEQSMGNNWAGLFELDKPNNSKQTPKTTTGYISPNIVYREADRVM